MGPSCIAFKFPDPDCNGSYSAPNFLYDLIVMHGGWIGKQTVVPSSRRNNTGLWGAKSIHILAARIGVSTRALTNFN